MSTTEAHPSPAAEHEADAVESVVHVIPVVLPVVGGLLIFLLVPEAATQKHLEILSEIAELLSDAPLREKIKASTDAAELHRLIAAWQSAQPA